jgi:drug/metabolite transporter (DMT)-like permease
VIKEGYGGLGPFNAASIRFLIAGALTLPLVPLMGVGWPQAREWLLVLWVGATLFTVEYGLIYWGEQTLDSGITAVLFSVLPILTAVGAHLYLPAERLTARKLAGTLVAILGGVALFGDSLRFNSSLALPMLAILASAIFATLASLATKKHGGALHPAALNAGSMLVGDVLLAGTSLAVGDGYRLPASGTTWGAILYLAIAGSVVTFLIYFRLLKVWSALGVVLVLAGVLLALTKGAPNTVATTTGSK